MPKLFSVSVFKSFLSVLVMLLSMATSANDTVTEITIKSALETAQAHTPGKVVAQEMADELVSEEGSLEGSETLQPVYRIKILSQQGVMKTLLVHRQTGRVIE
jgi:uncharacterized membrane protein YkoI